MSNLLDTIDAIISDNVYVDNDGVAGISAASEAIVAALPQPVSAAQRTGYCGVQLQVRKPDGGDWIDIYPAQLEWMAKEGNSVRAIERGLQIVGISDIAYTAWQPIETAPNHGEVLLWWKYAGVGVGSWDDEGNGWRCEGDECVPKNQSDCTHWMPKPAGPSVSSTPLCTPTEGA